MGSAPQSSAGSAPSSASSEVIRVVQKTKVRETVTSHPTLKAILGEVSEESERVLELLRNLPDLPLKEQQSTESELYVRLAVLREKISSALRQWERIVDEELPET